jgi:hypothetical protein
MQPEHPIVNLRTVEDLKKVLFMQRLVTGQAKKELLAVASDAELAADPISEKKATAFMTEERKILEKYANNPTLTEFNLIPNLRGGTKWGATFGVTLLVGELILEQVKAMQGVFEPVMRRMFLILLMEMDKPQHGYLVEPLEKAMKIRVTKPDGGPVPFEEQEAYRKRLVHRLVESFIIVGIEYGLFESNTDGFSMTPLGKRVLLHLLDAEKFVSLLLEAHQKFQNAKPKLTRKPS